MTNPHCAVLSRRLSRTLLLVVSTLAILIATLRAGGSTLPRGWTFALGTGDEALAEVIQNLLLFIPLGIALGLHGVRPRYAIAIGAALSFGVEFLQQWIPGRDPSVGDIICNTVSTAIGVTLVRYAPQWLTPAPSRSARQALATATVALLAWTATGVLVHPFWPPPPYRTVTTPNFARWGRYRGQVSSAVFMPFPLSTDVRDAELTVVAGSRRPGRSSPLVAILDERDTKVLIVTADRDDLGYRHNMRATHLTLETPDLRLRGALRAIAPGDTFVVRLQRQERSVCLAVNRIARCGFGYTVGDGWKLIFYPEHFPPWATGLLNVLWIAGWVVGVGYWGARGARGARGGEGRRRAAMGGAVAVVAVGLVFAPAVTGMKMTPLVEWLGAVGGFVVGYGLSRFDRVLKDRLGYDMRP